MSFIGLSGLGILLVLALVLFGAKRLPLLVRSARVGAKELKDSASGVSGLGSTVPSESAPLPPPPPPPVPPPVPVPDVPEAD